MAVYCAGILIAMVVVSALVVVLGNAAGGGRRDVTIQPFTAPYR